MKKRMVLGILTLVMITTFNGCSKGNEETVINSEQDTGVTEEAEALGGESLSDDNVEIEESGASDLINANNEEDAQDIRDEKWQQAYMNLINDIAGGKYDNTVPYYGYSRDDEAYQEIVDNLEASTYYVYDINKDDIPELIVKYGTCEADYDGIIYSYVERKDEVKCVGEIPLGHTSLLANPNENGMYAQWGHMGSQYIDFISYKNGVLVGEEIFSENLDLENPDAEYTGVDTICPGAVYLCGSRIEDSCALTAYRDWSCDLNADIKPSYVPGGKEEAVYYDTITGNGEVVGLSAYGYYEDAGAVSFEEFLAPGGCNPYSQDAYYVNRYAYTDINKDGITECILELITEGVDESLASEYNSAYVVLSYQYNTVYAYYLEYVYGEYIILENGCFKPVSSYMSDYSTKRIIMDASLRYVYYTRENDDYNEVEWRRL